jgi:phage gp46-like protein
MATIYVHSTAGNDGSADPTNPATPLQTMPAAEALLAGGAGFGLGTDVALQDVGPHDVSAGAFGAAAPVQGVTLRGPDTWIAGVYQWAVLDAGGAAANCVLTDRWWRLTGIRAINATGVGILFGTSAEAFGTRLRADNNGSHGIYLRSANAGRDIDLEWIVAHDNGGKGVWLQAVVAAIDLVVRNGIAYGNVDEGIDVQGFGAGTALAENCGAYDNGGGATTAGIDSFTARNCWALDNTALRGIIASVAHDNNRSHTTNAGVYHTAGNFGGVGVDPQSDELLPGLVNAAGGDFHPSSGSNLLGAGAAAATLTVDLDGTAYAIPYPIGPYAVAFFDLDSADGLAGSTQVVLVFSEALDLTNPDLTDDTLYAVTTPFGTVTNAVTAASATGSTVTLTVSPALYADQLYRVTVPATITASSGALIDPTDLSEDFVTGSLPLVESGNPWAVTASGDNALDPPLELVPADPTDPSASLRDAVWLSIYSDRLAASGDALPDESSDPINRGGWWGDTYQDDGYLHGSRLWLLRRSSPTPETLRLVEEYAVEALQWMVDDRLAARVDATATRLGADSIGLIVRLYRQGVEPTPIVFDDLWNPWR